jgi:hypothetical protein
VLNSEDFAVCGIVCEAVGGRPECRLYAGNLVAAVGLEPTTYGL